MRIKVNRIGAQGGSVANAASAVIDYLMGKDPTAEAQAAKLLHQPDVDGEVAYYADAVEGPGQWLGSGAEYWSLEGDVDEDSFRNVLLGRHPHTGERMVSARGSAERSHLRVGQFTATSEDGAALYSLDDALVALRLRPEDLTAYVKLHDNPREAQSAEANEPAMLHVFTDGDGNTWVESDVIDRFETHLASLRSANSLPVGAPAVLSLDAAAALVGVTPRYLRRIAQHYDDNADGIDAAPENANAFLRTTFDPNRVDISDPVTVGELADLTGCSYSVVWRAADNGDISYVPGTTRPNGANPARLLDAASATAWVNDRNRPSDNKRWVTRDELKGFVERRNPPAVRVGYDLTLTTEKSFSVVAMLGDGNVRDTFVQALDESNKVAIDYLERHATWTRVSHVETDENGRRQTVTDRVATEGLTVGSFLHGTSRALDPFLHRHNVVANATVDANGDTKTLDARAFYRHAPAAAALGSAKLRADLTRKFGIRWVQSPSGSWEIDGVPAETLTEFSQRSEDIAEALAQVIAEHGPALTPEDDMRRRDTAAFETRDEKLPTSRSELVGAWRERAAASGLTDETIRSCFGKDHAVLDRLSQDQETALYRWLDGPDGVTDASTVFSRVDVIQSIARWRKTGPGGDVQLVVVDPAEIERQADRFLASEVVVPLAVGAVVSGDVIRREDGVVLDNTLGEASFSTVTALRRQAEVLAACGDAGSVDVGGCSLETVGAAIAGSTLSDEQIGLVTGFCSGGARTRVAVGVAGAGKTYTLGFARQAWESAGWKVKGAAVSGKAAQELSDALPSETLAHLLAKWDNTGINPLDAQTVLVVDEAGTVSDRDLVGVVRMVTDAGAALRLIGDPAQHGSVQAGGLYRMLCEDESTIRLTTSRRVRHDVDREAASLLRGDAAADPAAALQMLKDAGHLIVTSSESEAYVAVLTRWWTAHLQGADHPIVEATNRVRLDLNSAAQQLRRANGEIGEERLTGHSGREFSPGDQVIARINDRDNHPAGKPTRWLRNGNAGVVTAIDGDTGTITVEFEGIGPLELPQTYWDLHTSGKNANKVGLELGYSVTSHGVQGATLEQSTSLLTTRTTRAEAYVNISRGKHSNAFVLVERDEGEIEYLPAPEGGRALDDQIASNLMRDEATPAIALDPQALDVHELAKGRTLAQLQRAALRADPSGDVAESHPILHRAITQRTSAVRAMALTDPPDTITDHLPEKPKQPHLARQWEQAVADVAVHQARWETKPTATAAWGHLLGPDRDAGQQRDDRTRVITALVELHVAMDLRHIRDTTPRPETVAGTPLSQLGDTVAGGVDTAQLVDDATTMLDTARSAVDGARAHQRELERTLAKLENQNPGRRLRDRRLITTTRADHESSKQATRTLAADVAQAEQTLADAKTQHQRAADTLPTSPAIAARTATLRRTTAAQPPPWATAHLSALRRSEAPLTVAQVATLHTEAAAYRERWDVDADAPGLAGPRPDGPTDSPQLREWAALHRQDPVPAPTPSRTPDQIRERVLTR